LITELEVALLKTKQVWIDSVMDPLVDRSKHSHPDGQCRREELSADSEIAAVEGKAARNTLPGRTNYDLAKRH
jgi:hypothetical protein